MITKNSDNLFVVSVGGIPITLTFDELESLSVELGQVVMQEYSEALQGDLDMGGDDCESGACKI